MLTVLTQTPAFVLLWRQAAHWILETMRQPPQLWRGGDFANLWKVGENQRPLRRTGANFPAEAATRPEPFKLFGPSPLMEGEDIGLYDDLLTRISTAIKPNDILEDIWVREVVDLVWETFRLRRLKWTLLTATAAVDGLTNVLFPLIGWGEADALAKAWASRKPSAIKRVKKILASADLNMDAVTAQTLSVKLDDIERIDRMIAMAEARRNAILREVDRHRETLSQSLRQAVQQAEDGQLRVIESTSINGTNAE